MPERNNEKQNENIQKTNGIREMHNACIQKANKNKKILDPLKKGLE